MKNNNHPHSTSIDGWRERLMDEFCIMFERAKRMSEDEYFWVEKLESFIGNLLQSERKSLIAKINEAKTATQKETGAFKYDFAYEEIIEIVEGI